MTHIPVYRERHECSLDGKHGEADISVWHRRAGYQVNLHAYWDDKLVVRRQVHKLDDARRLMNRLARTHRRNWGTPGGRRSRMYSVLWKWNNE